MMHKDEITFIDNFDPSPSSKDKEESSDKEERKPSPVDDDPLMDPNHWDLPVPVSATKSEVSLENKESGFFDVEVSEPRLRRLR